MSAPTSKDPLFVNTAGGQCWKRQHVDGDGRGLYALADVVACPAYVLASFAELAELGISGSADVLPVPVLPEPQLALPWAHEMPDGDLSGFLDDLVSAALNRWRTDPDGPVPDRVTLADIERVCREWRTPGVGYRSDPEPEVTPSPSFAERAARESDPGRRVAYRMLAEPDGEFDAYLRHPYRTGHDLPETGGGTR